MMHLLLAAPSCFSAFLSGDSVLRSGSRGRLMFAHMCAVAWKQNQVLVTVVAAIVVQVMHALARFKETTNAFLDDQAMLVDVALPVGVRMVRRVQQHVARRMYPPTTAPFMTRCAALDLVAGDKSNVLALVVSTVRLIDLRERRYLAAAANAKTGGVRIGYSAFASQRIAGASFGGAAPVTAHEAFPILHCDSAAAFASGSCMFLHGCESNIDKDV